MTPLTPAWYVNGFCPASFVDQNFFIVCLTVPVACTVTVSRAATTGPLPALRICDRSIDGGGDEIRIMNSFEARPIAETTGGILSSARLVRRLDARKRLHVGGGERRREREKKKGDEERRSQNRAEHQWIGEIPGQSLY
jgi:hypothetical protein